MKAHFAVYQGADLQWYWRLVAANGRIVALGEGYPSRRNAERAVAAVKRAAKAAG